MSIVFILYAASNPVKKQKKFYYIFSLHMNVYDTHIYIIIKLEII